MAVLAGRTQRVLANGVYSGLAVAAALGALALGNALRHGLMAPMPAQTAVSASPQVDDARGTSHAAVAGLDAGADDFVVKPARAGELRARLKALVRRAGLGDIHGTIFEYDRFRFDLQRQTAQDSGRIVELTQKEFQLALLFLNNIGKPLSRGHIREAVWGRDSEVPSRTMDTHVSRVRSKLTLRPESGYLLAPVYSYGYRLERLRDEGEDADGGAPAPAENS